MNTAAQIGAGIALALSFAVLLLHRRGAVLPLLGLQGLAVAGAMAAQRGLVGASLVQALGAIAVPLLLGWLPDRIAARPDRLPVTLAPVVLAPVVLAPVVLAPVVLAPVVLAPVVLAVVAAALTVLVLPLGAAWMPLAIVFTGLLSAATARDPVLQAAGLGLAQSGIALASSSTVLACLPVMPLLAIGCMWPGLTGLSPLGRRLPHWFDPAVRLALPILPLGVLVGGGNSLSAVAGGLVCLLALPNRTRSTASLAALLAALGAAMAENPAMVVLAAALAIAATLYSRLPRAAERLVPEHDRPRPDHGAGHVRRSAATLAHPVLGALGIGLSLLGATATLPTGLGTGLFVLGLAVAARIVPLLAPALVVALLRQPPLTVEPVMLTIGLAGMVVCAAYAWQWPAAARRFGPLFLGQTAVAVFALGLGTPGAAFAALIHIVLVVLAEAAIAASAGAPAPRSLAIAGLAGVSPVGVFPSLALIAIETAQMSPWLLLPFAAALAGLAWPSLVRLAPPSRWQESTGRLAWLPLTACLLIGWLLPASLAAWLHGLTL